MKKGKTYARTKFAPEVLRAAVAALRGPNATPGESPKFRHLRVDLARESWDHESEDEFFADYRNQIAGAVYWLEGRDWSFRLQVVGRTRCSRSRRQAEQRSRALMRF